MSNDSLTKGASDDKTEDTDWVIVDEDTWVWEGDVTNEEEMGAACILSWWNSDFKSTSKSSSFSCRCFHIWKRCLNNTCRQDWDKSQTMAKNVR